MVNFTRRRVIQMAGGFALTGVAGRWLAVPEAFAGQNGVPAEEVDDFLAVSRQLVMRDELDGNITNALVHASKLALDGFTEQLTCLKALLAEQPALLDGEQLDFGAAFAAEEALARNVLSGWYTGVVGSGDQAIYVTHINALSNQVVADKLVPTSFSYGPCGSWHRAP